MGKFFFLVFSDMVDTAAPVSISIVNFFLLISKSTVMGCEDLLLTWCNGRSWSEPSSESCESLRTQLAPLLCCLVV